MAPIISYKGATSGSDNNPTSGTFSVSGLTWNAGDVAISCWYTSDYPKILTGSAAFYAAQTLIRSGSDAATGSYYIAYRVLQAGDTTWTWGSPSDVGSTTVWGTAVFGTTFATPLETSSSVSTQAANDPQSPAINTLSSGSCVLSFFAKLNDYTSVVPPTNFSYAVSHSSTSGNDASMGLAYFIAGNPGTVTPAVWTLGGGAVGDPAFVWTGGLKTGSNPALFTRFWVGDGFTYRYQASPTAGAGGAKAGAGAPGR